MTENYCCTMRGHFVLGIVAQRRGPVPVDVVDFLDSFETDSPTISIKYCPFCGKQIDRTQTTRVVSPESHE